MRTAFASNSSAWGATGALVKAVYKRGWRAPGRPMAHSMQQNHAKICGCQSVIVVQPLSRGLRDQFLASDWLFSLLWLPQTMESSVFLRKNQWVALRTAGHTSPKSATWAWFVGPLALQIGVKTDHLAAAWAFKIVATAMRAEQLAPFVGQSDPTSTCLCNFW